VDQPRKHQAEVRAGRQALRAGVGGQTGFGKASDEFFEVIGEPIDVWAIAINLQH